MANLPEDLQKSLFFNFLLAFFDNLHYFFTNTFKP